VSCVGKVKPGGWPCGFSKLTEDAGKVAVESGRTLGWVACPGRGPFLGRAMLSSSSYSICVFTRCRICLILVHRGKRDVLGGQMELVELLSLGFYEVRRDRRRKTMV
jgi:hypothetical protein